MASATLSKISLLSLGVVFFQVLKASFAASTALSTSSFVALTKVERVEPSTGDTEVHLESGFVEGTNSPFMNRS
jgi:hypothetical protein